jgi:uncharacterized protein
MRFDWDENKNLSNRQKHGISFPRATEAFYDLDQVTLYEGSYEGEDRWILIGFDSNLALLLVIHLVTYEYDDEILRIISARRANSQERKLYARENR